MTVSQLLTACAAGATLTALLIGPPVAKLIEALNGKLPGVECIRQMYGPRLTKLTQPEP